MVDRNLPQLHSLLQQLDCFHKVYYSTYAEEVLYFVTAVPALGVQIVADSAAASTVHMKIPPQWQFQDQMQ